MGMSYSNPSGVTAEERAQAREEAIQQERQDGFREHSADYQEATREYGTVTPFLEYSLNGLKLMLANANAGGIQGVGENWKRVHDQLVGPDGSGSGDCAYGQLQKAVDNVLAHWEGESANQFRAKASKILQDIFNTGTHCETVSSATKAAADDLRAQKPRLDALEEPGFFESAGDWLTDSGRDDSFTQEQIQNKDLPKDVLAGIEENRLSAGMEVKLQATAIMETLGRSYVQYQQRLQSGGQVDDPTAIPPSAPAVPMPTPIPPFSGSSPTPGTGGSRRNWSTQPTRGGMPTGLTRPRDVGISGGKQMPVSKTQIDSVKTGFSGPAGETFTSGGGTGRGAGSGSGLGLGAPPGGVPGGGRLGGGRSGGPTTRGPGVRAGIGGTGSGTTGRGSAGAGIRGGGGMGGGAGGRGAAAGGRGPLARAKGGVAGAPKGIVGGRPATPGGTGLGKGRGGASGNGSGARNGMLAGRMGSNQRPGDDENEQGNRPDYLVEDEETWTPEDTRSVPRTID